MAEFIDVEQNTDAWQELRAGRVTSSKLGVVMANEDKAFSKPAKDYAVSLAIERINGCKSAGNSYSNAHMERGHEQEPLARMAYEGETFCTVTNGGFFATEREGASPDGLVDDDGVIEIKSVIPSVHFANVKRQSFDPSYKWQLFKNLQMSGRSWIDFISYCADYPEGRRLYTYRIFASELLDEFERMDERLDKFHSLIDQCEHQIRQANYLNFRNMADALPHDCDISEVA